jgi:uroporphyrinogen decarboxylase
MYYWGERLTMHVAPREIVRKDLRFETPERIPRDLWELPWAAKRFPAELAEFQRRFPS